MAIQQVGGQGVYVITGSGRDPRKTSNGQSWADLVTQQKYMLIKQARQDAQRQIDREFQDYQSRQKATAEYRADVRKQIEEARGSVANLKLKQSEAQTDIDKQLLKAEIDRARGRKQTITSGSTSPGGSRSRASKEMSGAEFNKYLTDEITANQAFSTQTLEAASGDAEKRKLQGLISARNPEHYTPQQVTIFNALSASQQAQVTAAQEGQAEVTRLVKIRGEYNAKREKELTSDMRDIIVREQALAPQSSKDSGGGYQVRTEKYKDQTDLPDAPSVDYSELINPYEQRIKSLEQQLLQAESPTMPDLNETNRMRQIASQDYGLRTSYRPPQRQAEMDALGVQQPVAEPSLTPLESAMQEGNVDVVMSRDRGLGVQIGASGVVEEDRPREHLGVMRKGTPLESAMQEGNVDVVMSRDRGVGVQIGADGVVEEDRPKELLGGIDPTFFDESNPTYIPPVNRLTGNRLEDVGPFLKDRATEREIRVINQSLNKSVGLPIQPKPMETEIGNRLRELELERQAAPSPTPAPLPTPTRNIRDIYNTMLQSEEQREPSMASMFDPIKFGTAQEKQQLALKMIMEKAQELGPTNPAYLKVKKSILKQLEKVLDPKKARQQRLIEKNQSDNRGDYFALSREVRGLKEQNAQLVFSLFPVNQESKAEEADGLYKNAQKQIATNISDRLQRKKADEFLDLMYLAYMNER